MSRLRLRLTAFGFPRFTPGVWGEDFFRMLSYLSYIFFTSTPSFRIMSFEVATRGSRIQISSITSFFWRVHTVSQISKCFFVGKHALCHTYTVYTCKCRWLSHAFRCLAIQLRPLGESVPYQVHSPKRWQQSRAGCNNNNVVLQQTSNYRISVRAYDACRVKKHIRAYLAYLK